MREALTFATGPVVMLAEELARIDGIESAFIDGSFAARLLGDAGSTPPDVDVMVTGEPDVYAVSERALRMRRRRTRP